MIVTIFDIKKNKEVNTGVIIGNTYFKKVNRKKHFLRVVQGFAIQEDIIPKLQEKNVEDIVFIIKGEIFNKSIILKDFLLVSRKWEHGHGKQLVISEKFLKEYAKGGIGNGK